MRYLVLLAFINFYGCGTEGDNGQSKPTEGQPLDQGFGGEEDDEASATAPKTTQSPLMTLGTGTVLHTLKTQAIYWGPLWTNNAYTRDKITGMERFLNGYSNSSYAKLASEYGDKIGPAVSVSTHLGYKIDGTAVPANPTPTELVSKICKLTNNSPDKDAIYLVYTPNKLVNNVCGWHGWGNCANGKTILMAYIPDVDTPACSAKDTTTGNSSGLAAMANITAHELLETITNPRNNLSWMDASKSEIADKCNWVFPASLTRLTNGSRWKLQTQWSNAAYLKGSGMPNSAGQKGCVGAL
jgi:hypothetical protein